MSIFTRTKKRERKLKYGPCDLPDMLHTITDTIDQSMVVDETIDGVDSTPKFEDDLKRKYGIEFMRTPCNETIVFDLSVFLGVFKIHNIKYGYSYLAYLWMVDFLSVSGFGYEEPVKGLLQIKVRRWERAPLPLKLRDPRTAFVGKCSVTADKRRRITAVKPNLRDEE